MRDREREVPIQPPFDFFRILNASVQTMMSPIDITQMITGRPRDCWYITASRR